MMISRAARRCRDERGAAIVEFALVVPLFVFLLLGLIVFGLILALKQSVTQAAEEGARDAVIAPFGSDISDIADAEERAFNGARRGLTWLGDRCCAAADGEPYPDATVGAPLTIDADVIPCEGALQQRCMRVEINYPYGTDPIVPVPSGIPPFNFVIPDDLRSVAVVRIDN